jgi:hypothetical protein
MIKNKKHISRICIIAATAFSICASVGVADGYVMGSDTYRIDSDSVNSGGTSFSTSSSYSLGSSVGELGTGFSSSSAYYMNAGFWVPDSNTTYISITSPSDANLGAVSGLLGGVGNASSTWTVTTNNPSGYELTVVSGTAPALKAPNSSIADYGPSGSDPDFNFSIAASTAEFGFTVEGADTAPRFLDNGSACNAGSSNATDKCWDGFSVTPKAIATSNTGNHPSGTATVLKYRVQIGSATIQDESPLYESSITVTAIAL